MGRKSILNRKGKGYKDFLESEALRILVEVRDIRDSQRFRLKHGDPPGPNAHFWIRGEVFTKLLIPRGYAFVVELYRDEIRRWIVHHFPDLKEDQRQLVILERFVWSLTHEIWHIIEMNGDLEITFKGDFRL